MAEPKNQALGHLKKLPGRTCKGKNATLLLLRSSPVAYALRIASYFFVSRVRFKLLHAMLKNIISSCHMK